MGKAFPRGRGSGTRVPTFVLAESELELVPEEMQAHPKVLQRARSRRRAPEHLLLDQAVDHVAMRALPEGERRGRPDLAHVFLLLLQDSPLNAKGRVRVLLHTRRDELVRVRSDTRIMRNQAKFYQLCEDLLRQGAVPREDPLLTLEWDRDLGSVLDECPGPRVLLDEGGAFARTPEIASLVGAHGDATFVLGGFPRGGFRTLERRWFDHVLRVSDEPLSVWSALVPVLAGAEDALLAP